MKNVFIEYFLGTAFFILGLVSWMHVFSSHNVVLFIIDLFIALVATPYGVLNIIDGIIDHKKIKDKQRRKIN